MTKQQGFSFFGLLFFVAVLSAVVSIGLKILPPYMDFLTICDATKQTLEQPRMALQTNDAIMKKIANQVSINNIRIGELGKDAIKLRKEDGELYAEIAYSIEAPVFSSDDMDVQINMDFARTVSARATTD